MHPTGNTLLCALLLCSLLASCNSDSSASPDSGPQQDANLPTVGLPFVNSELGGNVTRLSDSGAGPSVSGAHIIKTDYSRVQAENADASQLLVFAANNDGLLQYATLPAEGGSPKLITLPDNNVAGIATLHDESEARWHPSDPHIIRFIQGQNSYFGSLAVFEYNTSSAQVSKLADLSGKLPAHWGNVLYGMTGLEGTYSRDGNRLAWVVESGLNNAETTVGYVAFDLRNGGEVLGTLDYDGRDHDHISMSVSGEHVVISAAEHTTVHPVDFSTERVLHHETQHSDLCISASGRDCYVAVAFDDSSDPNIGWVFMEDLASGQKTQLFNVFGSGNTSLHLSGRAFERPGWALMSTYNCSSALASAKCDRLSLIELTDNPQIIDLTSTRSSGENYYAEPHGTLSRDGLRAYFNSDWDNSGAINVYRLDIPAQNYP